MKKDNNKSFSEWIELKENLHYGGVRRSVMERQIWWAAIGENIGIEINGKSKKFSRPVLVYRKLSGLGFLAIPLTIQDHTGHPWYVSYEFQGKKCFAALAQIRVISVSRLYGKSIGQMSKADYETVREGFNNLYCYGSDDIGGLKKI